MVPYKLHPPLPVAGWHAQKLPFDVLFHSLFHGYLVIAYRSDLPEASRTTLRTWVSANAGERVVSTLTDDQGAPRLSLAEWGWELRCGGCPTARRTS